MSAAAPRFRRMARADRRMALIAAGHACLAREGIGGFTVDKVSAEAGVSRGLITHHFRSMDGLLAAIYAQMIEQLIAAVEAKGQGAARVSGFIDQSFAGGAQNRDSLRAWLALWGALATTPRLLRAHRRQYARYRAGVEAALAALARERGVSADIPFTAMMLISLIDGLWLEWCIDPGQISETTAKVACKRLLEPVFGRLD